MFPDDMHHWDIKKLLLKFINLYSTIAQCPKILLIMTHPTSPADDS